ncbi:hypothetical protein Acr_00g0053170 [Actinidia rufa]|uniref:Uncharacterized protein n=1 Tax=Actinidia rufa TaxID=165716 RepID=A0A7J0DLF6_9ERIC|nr:hypothetical protein Acr_00g0053170 [Actinidia rufa]
MQDFAHQISCTKNYLFVNTEAFPGIFPPDFVHKELVVRECRSISSRWSGFRETTLRRSCQVTETQFGACLDMSIVLSLDKLQFGACLDALTAVSVAPELFPLMEWVQAAHNTELNRAQLLVHDDEALDKFRRDHGIPNEVLIERPRPRKDANSVEGEGNRIPVCTWLIHQIGLRFPLSPLLKEVMARCRLTFMKVFVNFAWTVLVVDALMQKELTFSISDLLHGYYEFAAAELRRKVTMADIAQDHDTYLALAQAIMLPQDVANLAAEEAHNLESDLKKAKDALAAEIKNCEANDQMTAKSLLEVDDAKEKMNAALQELTELRKVASAPMYQRLACLMDLNTPANHPAWNVAAPEVEVPDPPEPYSPIMLLDFKEDEYANQPAEDGAEGGGAGDFEAANKLGGEVGMSGTGGED